ncbi:hypothetical protein MLD38_001439 [Melastoma candidum]|uniref:Uncharacterized protein n=1 Tax=Melastoma candidum TaxID=119954 RepID=A0ACB9SD93_9MYRT|nr:hypothetical protein MLD38_001439 [Melastoma candidum]
MMDGSGRIYRETAAGDDDKEEEEEDGGDGEVGRLGFSKRRRKNVAAAEESKSEIRRAIDEVSLIVKSRPLVSDVVRGEGGSLPPGSFGDNDCSSVIRAGDVPVRPFLSLCKLVLQVLDKIGPTMSVLRIDVHNNIQRLESLRNGCPTRYSSVVEVIEKEKIEGIARKTNSCCRAFVWLVRSLDFTAALLQRLAEDPEGSMEQAVEESYDVTLKPWHRWISSAAFKVALRLVPDTATFIELIKTKDAKCSDFQEEAQTLVSSITPLLEDIHCLLKSYGLDRLKSC